MMLYPSVNELNEKTDSRYTLVILAAKRARDIIDKKPILTEVNAERPVTNAAYEIAEELITYKRVEEPEEEPAEAAAEASVDEEPVADAEADAEAEDAVAAEAEVEADAEVEDAEAAQEPAN